MDDLFWAEAFGWPPDVTMRQSAARLRRLREVYGLAADGRQLRAKQDEDQRRALEAARRR